MTDTIKKGTVLWAIQNIKFESNSRNSITKGGRYTIESVYGRTVYVFNDLGEGHSFDTQESDTAYWGHYFSLTPPEDKGVQTEGKSAEQEIARLREENDRLRREIETLKAKW